MSLNRPPVPQSELTNAGGAYVRRAFDFGGRKLIMGSVLTQEELADLPINNLRALVNTGKIELYPKAPDEMYIAEKFVVPASHGKYHVVEGRKITDSPVTKSEAQALAKG